MSNLVVPRVIKRFVAKNLVIKLDKTNIIKLKKIGLKKSNEIQKYADIYLLLNFSTCFGRPSRLSSVTLTLLGQFTGC